MQIGRLICFASLLMSFQVLAAKVVQVDINGAITPTVAGYLEDAIHYAEAEKAEALLITLDTPGGLLEATRQMVQSMLASEVPVIVYIAPSGARAGSAGVFLTLAAKVSVMAPNTHLGAAHPVSMFGGNIEGDMKQKIENDAVAWARTLAQNQGRNADWAEKAVRESATLSDKEALEAHVVDFIATDIPELLDKASQKLQRPAIKEASIEVFEMSNKQKLMQGLSNPNLLYLLLLIGILGLFIEFQFPGMILPGLLGVLSLAIVFGVQLLPLNWFGVLLILGAVALLIAEMFIASFGLLSVGAFVLFVLGSYLLFEVEGSVFYVDPIMIWSVAVTLILIFVAFGYFIIRAKSQGATSGSEALVGQTAKVFETIAPGQPGSIYIQGSYWAASANEEIEEGALVVIERMESAQAVVKRV